MKQLENRSSLKELPRDRYFIKYFINDTYSKKEIPQKCMYILSTNLPDGDRVTNHFYIKFDENRKCFVTSNVHDYVVGKDFILYQKYKADEIFEITEDQYRLLILSEVI